MCELPTPADVDTTDGDEMADTKIQMVPAFRWIIQDALTVGRMVERVYGAHGLGSSSRLDVVVRRMVGQVWHVTSRSPCNCKGFLFL